MELNLTVNFATGRYHGRISEDELEFPPSPTRLFQALIAGSHCGAYDLIHQERRDRALRWLETLEPPVIDMPASRETGRGITNYVPNNDDQWPRTKVPNSGHVRTAKSFLATILPDSSSLLYCWTFDDEAEAIENAAVICAMARLVTHLGQHQDTVYVRGEINADVEAFILPESKRMVPIENTAGKWSAPQKGALDAYRKRYRTWLSGAAKDDVPVPARRMNYRSPETISFDAPMALFELWHKKDDEDKRLRYDPRDLRVPAAMVRHAMIDWLAARPAFRQHYGEELISHLIAGHDADKQYDGAHIACVPIPTMREEGVYDGLIRRVLLLGFGCESKAAAELFESVANGINGAALKDQSVEIGYLKKASLNDSVLRLFTGKARRVWRTVTPIILTGLMRRGRGAEVLLARTLKQAGVNEQDIESVAAFSGPIVPKTARALDYRIDKHSYLAQTPRYHAEVIFKRPVIGSLVVGRGRHTGFGLMMPCLETSSDDGR